MKNTMKLSGHHILEKDERIYWVYFGSGRDIPFKNRNGDTLLKCKVYKATAEAAFATLKRHKNYYYVGRWFKLIK